MIALGSNQRHALLGSPERVLTEAMIALEMPDIDVFAQSPITRSAAIGPSHRIYANAAAIISSPLDPPALLARLHEIEAHFGRERRGQRWRARVLDLDIILWSGGIWADAAPALAIPHPAMRTRGFVLTPAAMIAPGWRDPVTGFTIRQLQKRFTRPNPLDAQE
ncbi:MAG: 2-amino-4-hydroxy-6-hydroxymethyldihydropteridine diphosphokinase [Sphingorhabdus sp.]